MKTTFTGLTRKISDDSNIPSFKKIVKPNKKKLIEKKKKSLVTS